MNDFKQLCVWPAIICGEESIKDFEKMIWDEFKARIKYEAEIKTLPDKDERGEDINGTGNRNDLFFYVHQSDIEQFAIPRLKAGIRWWEDIFFNNQQSIYPIEFIKNHPRSW